LTRDAASRRSPPPPSLLPSPPLSRVLPVHPAGGNRGENRFGTTFRHCARFRMQTRRYKADPRRTMAYVIFAFQVLLSVSISLSLSLSLPRIPVSNLPVSLCTLSSSARAIPGGRIDISAGDRSLRRKKFSRTCVEIQAAKCIKIEYPGGSSNVVS